MAMTNQSFPNIIRRLLGVRGRGGGLNIEQSTSSTARTRSLRRRNPDNNGFRVNERYVFGSRPNHSACYCNTHKYLYRRSFSGVVDRKARGDHFLAKADRLEPREWDEACGMIRELAASEGQDPARIQDMFWVMSRLCEESRAIHGSDRHADIRSNLPLNDVVLTTVLGSWREYIRHTYAAAPKDDTQQFGADEFHPRIVLRLMEGFMDVGLVRRHPKFYNMILNALSTSRIPKAYVVDLAEDMVAKMVESPLRQFSINAYTVQLMVKICVESGLPNTLTKAEMYVEELARMYMQSPRRDLQPTPPMYCALIEAHSYQNSGEVAFDRMVELLQDMHNNCYIPASPKATAACYSRVANALAECQDHPDSQTMATAVLREMFETFRESHGFSSAYEMFQALNAPRFGMDVSNSTILRHSFQLLDYLSEARNENMGNDDLSVRPLSGKLFGNILVNWREHVRGVLNAEPEEIEGDLFLEGPQPSMESSLGDLNPKLIAQRIESYLDSGIVQPNTATQNIVLSSLKEIGDRDAFNVGNDLYLRMLTRCDFNPLDIHRHPSTTTVQEMVQLCGSCGEKDSPEKVDKYLDELKKWFQQTKARHLAPSVGLYCSIMDVHAQFSPPETAIARIKELFAEMKSGCERSQINLITYTRVCRAVAQCCHPTSPDVARDLLNEVCVDVDGFSPEQIRPIYATVLGSYLREERIKDAVALAEELDNFAEKQGDPGLALDEKLKGWIFQSQQRRGSDSVEYLLSTEPGSLKLEDWDVAKKLISSWSGRASKSVNRAQAEQVRDTFALLDRFSDQATKIHRSPGMYPFPPLDQTVFAKTLLLWKELHDSISSRTSGLDKEMEEEVLKLDPLSTFDRMLRFIDAGLVDRSPDYVNIFLESVKYTEDPEKAPYRGHHFFERMLERSSYSPMNTKEHPTKQAVQVLLDLWTKSGLPEAPGRAEACMEELTRWYEETKSGVYKADPRLYCSLMEVHGACSPSEISFHSIHKIFENMKSLCPDEEIDMVTCTRVCGSLANSNHPGSGDAAREVLDSMLDSYLTYGDLQRKPGHSVFSAVLRAYGCSGQADKAQELIEEMEHLAEDTGDSSFAPNHIHLSALIWAYARIGDVDKAQATMLRIQNEHGHEVDMDAWEGLLAAWSESQNPDSVDKMSEMIEWLQSSVDRKQEVGTITATTYNKLMSAYARKGTVESADSAQKLFKWMMEHCDLSVHPDRETYKSLVIAWSNSGKPDKAESILRSLCDKILSGELDKTLLHPHLFNIVISSWANSKQTNAAVRAASVFKLIKRMNQRPTVIGYNSLLWALARDASHDPTASVEELFQQMKKEWKRSGDFLKPNSTTYNAVLHALSRSNRTNNVDSAEHYVAEMKAIGVKPDVYVYTTLMNVYSRSKRPDKVEEIFAEMTEQSRAGDPNVAPTSSSHSTRTWAWAVGNDPEKATSVLDEWIAQASTGIVDRKPTNREFGAVLQAWLKSGRQDAAEQAESVLDKLVNASSGQRNSLPNVTSFTSVISAYARAGSSTGGKKALQIFQKQKKLADKHPDINSLQPNLLTYSGVIMALLKSRDPGVGSEVSELLQEMEHKDKSFWNEFRSAEVLEKLTTALHSSSLTSKTSLIESCQKLESCL